MILKHSISMKIIGIVLIILLIGIIAVKNIELWPSNDLKYKVYLLIKENEFNKLIELAEKSGYSHVSWVEGKVLKAGVWNGREIKWDKNAKLADLTQEAKRQGRRAFDFRKNKQGVWQFYLYSYKGFTNKRILVLYSKGANLKSSNCTDKVIEQNLRGSCDTNLWSNWKLTRQWETYK